MTSAVRERVMKAPSGAWLRPADLGGGNSVEQVLSRLARDPRGPLVRAAKGLYFKSGPADPVFGKRKPSPIEVAAEVAKGEGVGPAGATAAAYLGLTTQVPPRPLLAVVGVAPTGVPGVEWQTRNNVTRAQLGFTEVAVVEFLSTFSRGVDAESPGSSRTWRFPEMSLRRNDRGGAARHDAGRSMPVARVCAVSGWIGTNA